MCRDSSDLKGAPPTADMGKFAKEQEYSGLQGKALLAAKKENFPSRKEIMAVIPAHCFVKSTTKSLAYALTSCVLTGACAGAAYLWLPLEASWTLAWLLYAVITGTVVTGCWVVAHECGHGAFSESVLVRDTVGYILHTVCCAEEAKQCIRPQACIWCRKTWKECRVHISLDLEHEGKRPFPRLISCSVGSVGLQMLLVPYFAWQRSHAVHHSRTNHVTEGETHVPSSAHIAENQTMYKMAELCGEALFTYITMPIKLLIGWPLYLLIGASGGPVRGATNHFLPNQGEKGKYELFPGKWKNKVWYSDVGIALWIGLLACWAVRAGSVMPVLALYGGPYLVCNGWLVFYTWLQHTDIDVPHLGEDLWTWEKGAFLTIDRPYGALLDFLHHRIGSTHVVHHLNHQVPHYHAREATEAIKNAFPDLYLYDPTPIWKAAIRVGGKCIGVVQEDGLWVYRSKNPGKQTKAL